MRGNGRENIRSLNLWMISISRRLLIPRPRLLLQQLLLFSLLLCVAIANLVTSSFADHMFIVFDGSKNGPRTATSALWRSPLQCLTALSLAPTSHRDLPTSQCHAVGVVDNRAYGSLNLPDF